MLREVDELFLSQLKASMEENSNGAYEPVFLKVKGMENKADFDKSKVTEYQYEVLGGTHNCLAAKELAEKYPELKYFQGRYMHGYLLDCLMKRRYGLLPNITRQDLFDMKCLFKKRYSTIPKIADLCKIFLFIMMNVVLVRTKIELSSKVT